MNKYKRGKASKNKTASEECELPPEEIQCGEGRETAHSAVPPTSQGTTREGSART